MMQQQQQDGASGSVGSFVSLPPLPLLGSQYLEPPRGLVFIVQTVGRVEVEFPSRGSCGGARLLVIQAVGRVEGEP